MSSKRTNQQVTRFTWALLQAVLKAATEERCLELLQAELTTERRPQFLLRIYGRLNRLRTSRERGELLKKAK